MQENKDATTGFDNGVYTVFYHKEAKTAPEFLTTHNEIKAKCPSEDKKKPWLTTVVPVICNYLTLTIIGLSLWGALWCLWGEGWSIQGAWFRLALVAVIAWASGQALQALTLLPPLLAALLTGILARNLGFLDMNEFTDVDMFLRKLYPIVILGKGALAWDVGFMIQNWKRVATLGILPWLAEVVVLAMLVHHFLGFPYVWGFLLGSIYASVSCPVVMPPVLRVSASAGSPRNWPQLVCTAGGIDTALSVGVYGLIYSIIFYEASDGCRYTKAALTLFAGVGLGVLMGCVAGLIPHPRDFYVTELRILLIVVGGLLANMLTYMFGWGGTGGVAVLACNATAATFWARDGWKLNNNPASTAYRVMWSTLEPILFAYTGTFFEINSNVSTQLVPGFAILAVCLFVRLTVAALTCWDFPIKEKLFVCCAWTPKSIVEAVLCPLALNTFTLAGDFDSDERQFAEGLLRLIVQAILITTPIGFLLTNHLGPVLLRTAEKDCEKDDPSPQRRKSINGSQNDLKI
ncbi:sodium/hydrogen exchanger 9B1-like isoform X1 [Ostrinia nubilalis]|uniref:sodium/hydrogen exchanger 9B1-like isoform X1 n=1 Tax=Ostrinia nubilalis TaxID=29057 RepID=UPI0030823C71